MLKAKIISSLEKCFMTGNYEEYREVTSVRTVKGQHLSLQLLTTWAEETNPWLFRKFFELRVEGPLAAHVKVRAVESVPVTFPVYDDARDKDSNYLSFEPGLYPDLLRPLHYDGSVMAIKNQLRTYWIDLEIGEKFHAGEYPLTLVLTETGYDAGGWVKLPENKTELTVTVKVLNAVLPEQSLIVTEWFHPDCLAQYYGVPVFSERHWEIMESFARTAVENGINMLLTPLFTPPLDTAIGGERETVQLVGVTKDGDAYSFDYSLLDRWIAMCDRVGVKYFEISHLFTQWGAGHAPKVMATVDGEYRRIFGWDTDATGLEYVNFLRTFLPDFLAYMQERGQDKRCYFHVSDEPSAEHLEQYRESKSVVADILEGYPIMDALSDYDFYQKGVVTMPIPANSAIQPFIDGGVKDLWTYYCCGQYLGVSNRLISMPSWRNRFIGTQFYKYDIKGFLQWGYNFYNNEKSVNPINPFADTCAENWVPGGDSFSVYPAPGGHAWESLRIIVFRDAIGDQRLLQLAETLAGRDAVIQAIESVMGEIRFDRCAESSEQFEAMMHAVFDLIEQNL